MKLVFEIGRCHGEAMAMEVWCNGACVATFDNIKDNTIELVLDVTLPTTLEFHTRGKAPNDTVIDPEGSIVEDKYIKLIRVQYDQMPVKKWILEKHYCHGVDQTGNRYNTNYIGYNGVTTISIPESKIFQHFLELLSAT
jgi:hypothetical protein